MTKNALLKRGPKNSGMGRPPLPIIRAMPERKRFFSIDVFPYQRWVFRITQPPKFPNFRFSVSDIQSNSYRASVFDGSWISGALAFPTIIGLSVTVLKWKMMWRCYWYNLTLCSLFLFQSQYIEISSRYIWRKMWAKFVTFYESILSKSFWLKTCQGKLNIN